jgi:hypothetical protein
MTEWWIIIHAPEGGVYAWPAGGDPGDAELNAARTLVGFPPNDDWIDDDSGWQLMLTNGEPHHTLMERAIVGTLADLNKVDPTAVAEHSETRRRGYVTRRAAAVLTALAALDDETLTVVLADANAAASARTGGVKP